MYNKSMTGLDLRNLFNGAVDDYDAIRPGYPNALIEDVIALANLPEAARLLEIGCGTGQATLPFARRGYRLLCLDIGLDLLAAAARNLAAYTNVCFQQAAFEDFILETEPFDLVFSATAFHWIPPEVGYLKAASLLKNGGALAVFSNKHPRPYTGFHTEVQAIYDQFSSHFKSTAHRPTTDEELQAAAAYIQSTRLFASVTTRTYPWMRTYTAAEYIQLLNTYSDHLALPVEERARLYQEITALIDSRYNGQVVRPYLSVLYLDIISPYYCP
jgi:SAM-dependent methyltransferase